MEFQQLLPDRRDIDVDELLDAIPGLAARAPEDRPYTVANFIASADGRATVNGRSGGLGDDGDRAIFHGLRERVDAVLAGTGTLRAENYGRILGKAERRERRAAGARTAEPLACMITRTGELPTEIPLFAEPEAEIVVFTPVAPDLSACTAHVEVIVLDPGELTLTTAMRRLRGDFGAQTLLCEGGPTLFGALLHEGLVDELFLTLAPKLTGGGRGPAVTTGPELPQPLELAITWLLHRHGVVYTRYAVQ
jgi:riboflavin biosynthesis pyrimidine reductase